MDAMNKGLENSHDFAYATIAANWLHSTTRWGPRVPMGHGGPI